LSLQRNTAYNLLGSLAPLAINIVTVPLYLSLIGEERYGILAILWLVLGYFGIFDLGLSRATSQRIASLKNSADSAREETFWTALAINSLLGLIGATIFWPTAVAVFKYFIKAEGPLESETLSVIPWFVAALPLATITGVFSGALEGRERFLSLNLINTLYAILSQIVPLAIAYCLGPNLTSIIPAVVLTRFFIAGLLFWRCLKALPLTNNPVINFYLAPTLIRYGGWITVTSVVGPLMVVLDRFIIGTISGAKAITHYTVPYGLVNQVTIVAGSISGALFPRFALSNIVDNQRLATDAVCSIIMIITPIIVAIELMISPILTFWIGAEMAMTSSTVAHFLLLGVWANSLALIPYSRLQAEGRADLTAKCHLAELPPYLLLLYFALKYWGVAGAAFAWSVRTTADCVFLFAISQTSPGKLRTIGGAFLFLMPATIVAIYVPWHNSNYWVFTVSIVFFCAMWSWHFSPLALKGALLGSIGKLAR
jgi:O-antigen/teichoic acid export membrane protein